VFSNKKPVPTNHNSRYEDLGETANFGGANNIETTNLEAEVEMFDKRMSNESKSNKSFSQKKRSEDHKSMKSNPSAIKCNKV